jgi:transposase-like protein
MPDLAQSSQLELSSLNEKQRAAMQLLLMGKKLSTIARTLGIDAKTLYRWRQDELFQEELDRRRRELWSAATDRLRALVHPAIDVLEQELAARYDRTRYRAANAVLRHANLRKCVPPENLD